METIKCIETRRSIRKFKEEQVSHEVMQEIVSAASFAPSWKNTQVTRYVVVENADIKAKIADEATLGFAHNSDIIKGCAALVVVNIVHGRSGFERDGSYTRQRRTAGKCLTRVLRRRLSALQRTIRELALSFLVFLMRQKLRRSLELKMGRR